MIIFYIGESVNCVSEYKCWLWDVTCSKQLSRLDVLAAVCFLFWWIRTPRWLWLMGVCIAGWHNWLFCIKDLSKCACVSFYFSFFVSEYVGVPFTFSCGGSGNWEFPCFLGKLPNSDKPPTSRLTQKLGKGCRARGSCPHQHLDKGCPPRQDHPHFECMLPYIFASVLVVGVMKNALAMCLMKKKFPVVVGERICERRKALTLVPMGERLLWGLSLWE